MPGVVERAHVRDTWRMTSCACPESTLTSLTFADGVVLVRCRVHELQTWVVEGRAMGTDAALPVLKDLFVEHRGKGGRPRAVPRKAPVRAPREMPAAAVDERLTKLLNARGLPGSWTVG